MKHTGRLRELLRGKRILIAPGAVDAWTARLIERAGFPVVYATGAGIANSQLAVPDLGLVTQTEMLGQVARIAQAVSVPVIADADTGYGEVLNVQRTIREWERAGVAGLHLEDQVMPKRCGHFQGKSVVPKEEMLQKLEAALLARTDPDFVIIARTDARAVHGLEDALDRARAYAAAGADAVFVEAPRSVDELEAIGQAGIGVPLVANMVEGGSTPLVPAAQLETLGFTLVLYANMALRLAGRAVQRGLEVLRQAGTSEPLLNDMLSFEERQALVGLAEYEALERHLTRREVATTE